MKRTKTKIEALPQTPPGAEPLDLDSLSDFLCIGGPGALPLAGSRGWPLAFLRKAHIKGRPDVVVPTGARRAFSAGGDVAWMRALAEMPGE